MFGSIPRDYIEISGLLFSRSEMKALSGRFPASRCFFFQNTMSVPRSGMQIQSIFLQNMLSFQKSTAQPQTSLPLS